VDISIKALLQGFGEAQRTLNELRGDIKKLSDAHEEGSKSTQKASAAWTEYIKGLAGYDVIKQAVFAVANLAKETVMLAGRYEELGIVMNVVGKNSGYTREQMEGFAKEVQKMGISMLESRNTVVQLAQAEIDLSGAYKLARAAQDTAVLGMTNSSDALARMIYGIKTGQTEVLRTLGINVSFEQSYQRLAAELHTTTAALNEKQKMQARENAVLEEAAKLTGVYEDAMTSATKQIRSMDRYIEDLKVIVGETFSEALLVGVMGFADALKSANKEADELLKNGTLKRWGNDVSDALARVADYMLITTRTMVAMWKSAKVVWEDIKGGAAFLVSDTVLGLLGVDTTSNRAAALKEANATWESLLSDSSTPFQDALAKRRVAINDDADKTLRIQQEFADRSLVIQKAYANYSIEIQQAAQLALAESTGLSYAGKFKPVPGLIGSGKAKKGKTDAQLMTEEFNTVEDLFLGPFKRGELGAEAIEAFYEDWQQIASENDVLLEKITMRSYDFHKGILDQEEKDAEDVEKRRHQMSEQEYKGWKAFEEQKIKDEKKTNDDVERLVLKRAQNELDIIRKTVFLSRDDRVAAIEVVKKKYEGFELASKTVQKELRDTKTDAQDFSEKLAQMFAFSVPNAILKTVQTIQGSLQSAIYDFFTGAKTVGEAIKGFFTGVKNAILQMFAELAAKKLLSWALGGIDIGSLLNIGSTASVADTASTALGGASIASKILSLFTGGAEATGTTAAAGSVVGLTGSTTAAAASSSFSLAAAIPYLAPLAIVMMGINGRSPRPANADAMLAVAHEAFLAKNPWATEEDWKSFPDIGGFYRNTPGDVWAGMSAWSSRASMQSDLDASYAQAQASNQYATGTDMVVTRPTVFTAGEVGAERVQVTPLSGGSRAGHGGITINGPAMFDEYTFRRFRRMLLEA